MFSYLLLAMWSPHLVDAVVTPLLNQRISVVRSCISITRELSIEQYQFESPRFLLRTVPRRLFYCIILSLCFGYCKYVVPFHCLLPFSFPCHGKWKLFRKCDFSCLTLFIFILSMERLIFDTTNLQINKLRSPGNA